MRRSPSAADFAAQRADMVEWQLRRRGIRDQSVLNAMAAVPRELFVPERYRKRAYADSALPIGHGQTISQPWIVAAICEALALEGSERVLEVGTGSGYSAAVLAMLAAEVITIERIEELAIAARQLLAELGITNVEVVVADGSAGFPDRAPYEAIAVHATAPSPPRTLIRQLAPGGRLVIPIASDGADMLTVFRRLEGKLDPMTGEGLQRTVIGPCRFVPLVGSEGYPE
ncbi:MAG: protein-L-isoaspartate(D-aspartate) O-methyltransferase [Actinobacteria bacterium]|nr:MAG: protein-L-isoaspartate(D-aspartate) O-methyltransferase [Actinomycetota bacterium]